MALLTAAVLFLVELAAWFAAWTLTIYLLHRLAHWPRSWNVLWRLHQAHHRIPYLSRAAPDPSPRPGQFVFWLGSAAASLDVIVMMTLPLVFVLWIAPAHGCVLLAFHYVYEVFFSEGRLDHNPRIGGGLTRYFAWGHYHLHHHLDARCNYSLMVTLWDHVFGTARMPEPGLIPAVVARRSSRAPAASAPSAAWQPVKSHFGL